MMQFWQRVTFTVDNVQKRHVRMFLVSMQHTTPEWECGVAILWFGDWKQRDRIQIVNVDDVPVGDDDD